MIEKLLKSSENDNEKYKIKKLLKSLENDQELLIDICHIFTT